MLQNWREGDAMGSRFLSGFGYAMKGLKLIFRPGVRRFVLIPFIINLGLFGTAIVWGYGEVDAGLDRFLPGWLHWLRWLLIPVFFITLSIIVFYTFTLIANLLGAPFNSVLSEKTEHLMTHQKNDAATGIWSLAKDIPIAIMAELKKLAYLLFWSIPLLILFLIPGLNLLAPIAWTVFGMWMLALQYIDYPMGNHGLNFAAERQLLRQNKQLAWGFGAGILLITFIPVLNFLAMPAGVTGATALWVEKLSATTQ